LAENPENSRESLSLDVGDPKEIQSQNNQKVKLKKVQITFNIATKKKKVRTSYFIFRRAKLVA
jgi:hypothetical protein